MTFVELVKEVKKECKSNSTRFVVEDILFTALRVFVEELYSDPDNACIDIGNFMKFHLIKDSHSGRYGKDKELVTYHYYRLVSTPRKGLKNVLNNRAPIEYYKIATKPLYPDKKKPRKKCERKKPYVPSNPKWKWRPKKPFWGTPPEVQIEITEQEDFLRTDIGKRSLEKEEAFKKRLIRKRERERLEEERRKKREERKKKVDVTNLLPEDDL